MGQSITSPSPVSEDQHSGVSFLTAVPNEILEIILMKLDLKSILTCRLVCQKLASVISDEQFWRSLMVRHAVPTGGLSHRQLWTRTEGWHWQLYALLCLHAPLGRNLLRNGSAELNPRVNPETGDRGSHGRRALPVGSKSMPGWEVVASGGDGWQVERPPQGVPDPPEACGGACFVTSYQACERRQVVPVKGGAALRTLQPQLVFTAWLANRWDCRARYSYEVRQRDARGKVLHCCEGRRDLDSGEWTQVREATPLLPACRRIEVADAGQDRQFWSGWYGAKVSGVSVQLCLAP